MSGIMKRRYDLDLGVGHHARFPSWVGEEAEKLRIEINRVFEPLNFSQEGAHKFMVFLRSVDNYPDNYKDEIYGVLELIKPRMGNADQEAQAIAVIKQHAAYEVYEYSQKAISELTKMVDSGDVKVTCSRELLGRRMKVSLQEDLKQAGSSKFEYILEHIFLDPKTARSKLSDMNFRVTAKSDYNCSVELKVASQGRAATKFQELAARSVSKEHDRVAAYNGPTVLI